MNHSFWARVRELISRMRLRFLCRPRTPRTSKPLVQYHPYLFGR
ncbi:MAG: hypothetical protein R3E79_40260 [Caldilineaceae bacterium]